MGQTKLIALLATVGVIVIAIMSFASEIHPQR